MTSAPARIASRVSACAARNWSGVWRSPVGISTTDRPLAAERGEVVGLVEVALLLDQGDRRVILADRLVPEALDAPEFQRREVVAGKVSDEIRGTDDEGPVVGDCTSEP